MGIERLQASGQRLQATLAFLQEMAGSGRERRAVPLQPMAAGLDSWHRASHARGEFIAAAAQRWNGEMSECVAENGFVIHKASARKVSFGDLAAGQASVIHDWVGHSGSFPVNAIWALGNGVTPAQFDLLRPNRFLGDPARPYGRIDIGTSDADFLGEGWHTGERAGDQTFRHVQNAGGVEQPGRSRHHPLLVNELPAIGLLEIDHDQHRTLGVEHARVRHRLSSSPA